MFKKLNIFQILYIIVVCTMPRLSRMLCFLKSFSFWQAQSALIGQLNQSILIGQTPQAASEL